MRCNFPWTKNVDEELLQIFHRQQLERSSHVKNALSLYQSDIVLRMEEKRRHRKLHSVVAGILESQKQSQLISQKKRSNPVMGSAKVADHGQQKRSCSKGKKCLFESRAQFRDKYPSLNVIQKQIKKVTGVRSLHHLTKYQQNEMKSRKNRPDIRLANLTKNSSRSKVIIIVSRSPISSEDIFLRSPLHRAWRFDPKAENIFLTAEHTFT